MLDNVEKLARDIHAKCPTPGQALGLICKWKTRLEKLGKDIYSKSNTLEQVPGITPKYQTM